MAALKFTPTAEFGIAAARRFMRPAGAEAGVFRQMPAVVAACFKLTLLIITLFVDPPRLNASCAFGSLAAVILKGMLKFCEAVVSAIVSSL